MAGYKHKSHKALLKRVKITGRGKIKFRGANTGHLKSRKNAKRLRHLKLKRVAKRGDIKRLEKMLHRPLTPKDEVRPVRKPAPAPSPA